VTGTGAGGAPAGDAIQVVQTGTGAVTVQTFGNVAGNAAALGGDAINISSGGTGPVLVHTFTAVTGDPAIIINMGWAGTDRHRRILADGEWSGSNQRHLDREHRTGRGLCERDQHRHGGQRHLHQHHRGGSRARHGQHGYGAPPECHRDRFAAINANTVNGTMTVNVDQGATATNSTGIGVGLNTGTTGTAHAQQPGHGGGPG
jgi:hypothetical protein